MAIKDRILYFAENKGISKQKFFQELELNYGNFKGNAKKSALSTDSLVKILSKYPSVNPDWLLFGEGVMEKEAKIEDIKLAQSSENVESSKISDDWASTRHENEEVSLLIAKSKIESLERENLLLREMVALLKGKP